MRRELTTLLAAALLVAVAWVGYRFVFEGGPRASLTLVAVEGPVTRSTTGGGVAPAEVGDTLGTHDRLAAGEGGRAVLAVGEGSELALDASSTMRILEVEATGVRVELEDGRVRATVRPGAVPLGVRAGGSEATARDAEFTVARGADGTVAVRGDRGEVTVTGPGGAVNLFAGQQAVVPSGRKALVQPASAALLLQVAPPEAERVAASLVEVRGTTEPGARVTIRGSGPPVQVVAGADGGWSARVALVEGLNEVEVRARSLLGGEAAATWRITRDTEGPAISVEMRP